MVSAANPNPNPLHRLSTGGALHSRGVSGVCLPPRLSPGGLCPPCAQDPLREAVQAPAHGDWNPTAGRPVVREKRKEKREKRKESIHPASLPPPRSLALSLSSSLALSCARARSDPPSLSHVPSLARSDSVALRGKSIPIGYSNIVFECDKATTNKMLWQTDGGIHVLAESLHMHKVR